MNYYNIKKSIHEVAEFCGMNPIATGGNCDYMVLKWEHLNLVLCTDSHESIDVNCDLAWEETCCIVVYDSPFGNCEVDPPKPICVMTFDSPLEALVFIKNFDGTIKL